MNNYSLNTLLLNVYRNNPDDNVYICEEKLLTFPQFSQNEYSRPQKNPDFIGADRGTDGIACAQCQHFRDRSTFRRQPGSAPCLDSSLLHPRQGIFRN